MKGEITIFGKQALNKKRNTRIHSYKPVMIQKFKQFFRPYFINYIAREIPLQWIQKDNDASLVQWFKGEKSLTPPVGKNSTQIEKRAQLTNAAGAPNGDCIKVQSAWHRHHL